MRSCQMTANVINLPARATAEAPDRPMYARFIVGATNSRPLELERKAVLQCAHGSLWIHQLGSDTARTIGEGEHVIVEHTGPYILRSRNKEGLFSVAEVTFSRPWTAAGGTWIDPRLLDTVTREAQRARAQAMRHLCASLVRAARAIVQSMFLRLRELIARKTHRR